MVGTGTGYGHGRTTVDLLLQLPNLTVKGFDGRVFGVTVFCVKGKKRTAIIPARWHWSVERQMHPQRFIKPYELLTPVCF